MFLSPKISPWHGQVSLANLKPQEHKTDLVKQTFGEHTWFSLISSL